MAEDTPDATAPVCQLCGRPRSAVPLVPAAVLQRPLVTRIRRDLPAWREDGFVCVEDLNRLRTRVVQGVLEEEIGELTSLERSVVDRLATHETLASNVDAEFDRTLTLGERMADRVAEFGGSWGFILLFAGFMACWMVANSFLLAREAFDPFPYILLNLVLSCLAAVQAPVIMMSQNRQEARDRLRARNDYLVNLKAELEIRLLHEKVDHLLQHQWERLMTIQEIQLDLMSELTERARQPRSGDVDLSSIG
ncbi:MAG: DUF1003 domain-containing protein [Geminicoccaceae bacterium]